MKERLDYIDRARGVLIILMVIGHVWQSGFVFDVIYAFHMPGFFVISGMLMQHTGACEKPFGKFLWGKILAYGIPFVWIEILGVLTDILRNGVTLNVKGYIFNTLIFDFNDPNLWFLVDLFLIEVLVVVMMKTIRKPAVIGGIAGVLFFVRYALPTQVLYVSTLTSVMKYLPLFLAGFFGHRCWKKVHIPTAMFCAAVVLIRVMLDGHIQNAGKPWADIAYMIGGLCGTYAVLCLVRINLPAVLNRILAYSGRNTILIYGTHHIYYAALGVLLGVRDYASTPVGVGLVILAGVAVLEIPTIYIINRWLPILTGKRRKRPVTA